MELIDWNKASYQQQQLWLARPEPQYQSKLIEETQSIIDQVSQRGDCALFELIQQFNQVVLNELKVKEEDIQLAVEQLPPETKASIEFAIEQIKNYHEAQIPRNLIAETCEGVICERQARPIARVGLYVPGGVTPSISTVIMLAVPAVLAGCPLRIICTPPNEDGQINPILLATAHLCGIENIYKIGGVQAIAAMALGTETIPKVDKILGPGNTWVVQAKALVEQQIDGVVCDLPSGPSEIVVIADEQANPDYVAADLLSQAERGADSQIMCLATSASLAHSIQKSIKKQLNQLSRKQAITASLQQGRLIIVDDIHQAINISNQYAPEHLILQVMNPDHYIHDITAAGAVSLGPWAPRAAGDYVTGLNHVLPTYGYAKQYSGLSVMDFMTYINFQTVTDSGLLNIAHAAEKIAEIEGLEAYQQAIRMRLKTLGVRNNFQ